MKKLIILTAMLCMTGCFTVNQYDPQTVHQIDVTADEDAGIENEVLAQPLPPTASAGLKARFSARGKRLTNWRTYESAKNPTNTPVPAGGA